MNNLYFIYQTEVEALPKYKPWCGIFAIRMRKQKNYENSPYELTYEFCAESYAEEWSMHWKSDFQFLFRATRRSFSDKHCPASHSQHFSTQRREHSWWPRNCLHRDGAHILPKSCTKIITGRTSMLYRTQCSHSKNGPSVRWGLSWVASGGPTFDYTLGVSHEWKVSQNTWSDLS